MCKCLGAVLGGGGGGAGQGMNGTRHKLHI